MPHKSGYPKMKRKRRGKQRMKGRKKHHAKMSPLERMKRKRKRKRDDNPDY